ncbi:MAG: hypothetical protein K8R79_00380 [Calditrichales bacterium]|nr:hypothetical protein [Calditrichales bacterium]
MFVEKDNPKKLEVRLRRGQGRRLKRGVHKNGIVKNWSYYWKVVFLVYLD